MGLGLFGFVLGFNGCRMVLAEERFSTPAEMSGMVTFKWKWDKVIKCR